MHSARWLFYGVCDVCRRILLVMLVTYTQYMKMQCLCPFLRSGRMAGANKTRLK